MLIKLTTDIPDALTQKLGKQRIKILLEDFIGGEGIEFLEETLEDEGENLKEGKKSYDDNM